MRHPKRTILRQNPAYLRAESSRYAYNMCIALEWLEGTSAAGRFPHDSRMDFDTMVRRIWTALLILSAASWAGLRGQVRAQESLAAGQVAQRPAEWNPSGPGIRVGLGGAWKLGHVCPVAVRIRPEHRSEATLIEVETVDGDGVKLVYRKQLDDRDAAAEQIWVPVRIGGRGQAMTVRISVGQRTLYQESIDPYAVATAYPSTQPLVLAIGSGMGVEALSRQNADGSDANFSTVVVDSASQLPTSYRDYSACDLIVISTSDPQLLQSLSVQQWQAIQNWIQRGGGCIVSLASPVQALQDIPGFMNLLPGTLLGDGQVTNPAALESYMVTDQPLQAIPVALLELDQRASEVVLWLTDSLSRRLPWWVAYPLGHGTVRLIASDLDAPALRDWKDRKTLWERLLEPYFSKQVLSGTDTDLRAGAANYLGYDDLVGQLRASLEVFQDVRVISFGQISLALILILLLIGPVDYLVCVKWLERPEWSWAIGGGMLAAISIGLISFYESIRPAKVLVNMAQIVDVDGLTGDVHGRLWGCIYSARAQQITIRTAPPQTAVSLDWQGLPGHGLGGLQSQLHTDRGMPAYAIELSADGSSQVHGVGLPAAGTKCINGSWDDQLPAVGEVSLRQMVGLDQLEGMVINPLPVELMDAVLFYHNWYYVLNSRIAPGERLPVSADTIPKTLVRRLNRQRNIDGSVSATRWDPAELNELDRLLELMMFYRAASGSNYTSLDHRYEPLIDQSSLLDTDLAVLVGRLEHAPVSLQVMEASEDRASQPKLLAESGTGIQRVWVRITLPVARPPKD